MNQGCKSGKDNAGAGPSCILFCDARCEHADFARQEGVDGSGSCRTFAALYCRRLEEHVTKNAPCSVQFGKRRPKANW